MATKAIYPQNQEELTDIVIDNNLNVEQPEQPNAVEQSEEPKYQRSAMENMLLLFGGIGITGAVTIGYFISNEYGPESGLMCGGSVCVGTAFCGLALLFSLYGRR